MTITAEMATFDCADPQRLAAWWATALGVEIDQDHGEFVLVKTESLTFGFQLVPEAKAGKNRVHLDFLTDDYHAEVDRLVRHGATIIGEHTMPGLTWTTLQDPEGNEFDIAGMA